MRNCLAITVLIKTEDIEQLLGAHQQRHCGARISMRVVMVH